jgi:hypothetical protein
MPHIMGPPNIPSEYIMIFVPFFECGITDR